MPWTYSGNPGSCDKDQVRFLISDTNIGRQLVQDEEIEWLLTQEMNVYMAAAAACRSLIIKAGGTRRKRISDFDISYDVSFYRTTMGELTARGSSYQIPYAGGISASDKMAQQSDVNAVTPAFVKNLDENAAAPQPATPPVNPLSTI